MNKVQKFFKFFSVISATVAAFLLIVHCDMNSAGAGVKVGYPQQCTDRANNPRSAYWMTCDQMLAGTDIATPLYVTGTTLFPDATITATVDATEDQIFAPYEVLGWKNWTLWVKNTGAAALTNVIVYTSPDGTDFQDDVDYKVTGEASCETVAAGGTCKAFIASGASVHSVKMGATCGTSTSVKAWITGNN